MLFGSSVDPSAHRAHYTWGPSAQRKEKQKSFPQRVLTLQRGQKGLKMRSDILSLLFRSLRI